MQMYRSVFLDESGNLRKQDEEKINTALVEVGKTLEALRFDYVLKSEDLVKLNYVTDSMKKATQYSGVLGE